VASKLRIHGPGADGNKPTPARGLDDGDVVELFHHLVAAVGAMDFQAATRYRRELYRAGWSILPPKSQAWRGGRS